MSLNDHFRLPDPLWSFRIWDVIAALKCARDAAGITEPLDNAAECSVAEVVWVSLRSLSLKFIVPDNRCSAVESVVLANSLKLPVAEDEVNVGV